MSVFSGAGQINDLQLLTYLQLDFNLTKIQYSSYVGQHCIKEDILLGGGLTSIRSYTDFCAVFQPVITPSCFSIFILGLTLCSLFFFFF